MSTEIDGEFVRKNRLRLGKSQEQLCIEFDIQRGWLSEVERNVPRRRNPDSISRLADALQVDVQYLYKGIKSLSDCRDDYRQWENAIDGDHVLVRCIGLDMANGWEAVVRSINGTSSTSIRLEFLVIYDPDETMIYSPPTFRMWTEQSANNIKMIKSSIATWNPASKASIEVCFRGYAETPDMHGIYSEKSGNRRWWITRCKAIDGPDALGFTWGEDTYHIINGENADDVRVEEFNQRFERLWQNSNHVLIEETVIPDTTSPT